MAATLSREDVKLEQLIHVESVQIDGEEWELGGPRGFGQDTVCVQEKLQYHGLATYLVRIAPSLGSHGCLMCHRAQTMRYHWYSRVWTLDS